eukprot:100385-Chlamydomonas_euryale.AAC.6
MQKTRTQASSLERRRPTLTSAPLPGTRLRRAAAKRLAGAAHPAPVPLPPASRSPTPYWTMTGATIAGSKRVVCAVAAAAAAAAAPRRATQASAAASARAWGQGRRPEWGAAPPSAALDVSCFG